MSFERRCVREFGVPPEILKILISGGGDYTKGFLEGYRTAQEEFVRILKKELEKAKEKL